MIDDGLNNTTIGSRGLRTEYVEHHVAEKECIGRDASNVYLALQELRNEANELNYVASDLVERLKPITINYTHPESPSKENQELVMVCDVVVHIEEIISINKATRAQLLEQIEGLQV